MPWRDYWNKKGHIRKRTVERSSSINAGQYRHVQVSSLSSQNEYFIGNQHWIVSAHEISVRFFDGSDFSYKIPLERTVCNFGGYRSWFRCPLPSCHRRCGKLYRSGTVYACRHCLKLSYASQQENPPERLLRKRDKILRKLTDEKTGVLPTKPKGMHRSTYIRMVEAAERLDYNAALAFSVWHAANCKQHVARCRHSLSE